MGPLIKAACCKQLAVALVLIGALIGTNELISCLYPVPDSEWTIERMANEMAKLGFKSQRVTADQSAACAQGLYLARENDPRSWEEIISNRPKVRPDTNWSGLVIVNKAIPSTFTFDGPGELTIGAFEFFGDPAEIDCIARHFRMR